MSGRIKRLFVWRGGDALRNYSSGLAVVFAYSINDAWKALRTENESAYWQLQLGHHFFHTQTDWDEADPEDRKTRPGFPIHPEIFDLDKDMAFVRMGGE